MFRIWLGEYELACQVDGLPYLLAEYQQRATLAEDFPGTGEADESVCFVSIAHNMQWPFLVVVQRYSPACSGFHPGILVVPETHRLFIGAGRRLLGYDLLRPARSWEDQVDCGFLSWSQHGRVVLMAAELELAAWETNGIKLWSQYVESPWDYRINGETVILNVMETISILDLWSGKAV